MDHDDAMRAQEAWEPAFVRLAEMVEASGVTKAEAAEVLLGLAMAHLEMVAAMGETEAAIARARATVGGVLLWADLTPRIK